MNNTTLGKFNLNYEKRIIGLLGLDLVESKGANRWEIRDKLENSAGYVSLHKKTLTTSVNQSTITTWIFLVIEYFQIILAIK